LIVGGILGLLAFVLALTLSYANTRFDERRHATLEEANAIGTAWLKAEAINDPRGRDITRLLEDYTAQRKFFLQARRQSVELAAINKRTSDLQTEIWAHATAISHERSDDVVAALMQSLNDVFDMSSAQRFAHDARFPPALRGWDRYKQTFPHTLGRLRVIQKCDFAVNPTSASDYFDLLSGCKSSRLSNVLADVSTLQDRSSATSVQVT